MKSAISKFVSSIFSRTKLGNNPVAICPPGEPRGCVAISYIKWPFQEGWDSSKARGHTNAFEVVAMAEAWRAVGYRVEICDYEDFDYRPPGDTQIAIDLHGHLEHWKPYLPPRCRTILHATGCHWRYQNSAEKERLSALYRRRGVRLRPRRQVAASRSAEIADQIVIVGNDFTAQSFACFGKPITRVPISSAYQFDWPKNRDWTVAKHCFLWLGSHGMVHKGLDLVIEAFASMPELQLTICGRPEKELDFFQHYEKELKCTPNINLRGWMDLSSSEFGALVGQHGSVICASCSEGGGGSVIHGMHAGLIPAATRETSVDLEDFGILIETGSVEAVRSAARAIASMSPDEAENRARQAWCHVRSIHTRAEFRRQYQSFVQQIVIDHD